MRFELHAWLWLSAAVALGAAGCFCWGQRRRAALLRAALATPLLAQLTSALDPRRRTLKQGVFVASLALITLALARPRWGQEPVTVERTGVDVILALDVSRSMLAPDVEDTNRLAAARAAVRHLLHRMGGDRVGLVAFAGEAFLAAPLTRDHVAVERALDALAPGSVSEPGSSLAKAIERAREGFDRAGEGPRVLLLISDGEQLQGDGPAAARAAATAGVAVHCAGVGSALGARLPATGGLVRNAFGREVVSRLDERVLQQVAEAGRGRYVRLGGRDSDDLVGWFTEASAGLPGTTESRETHDPRERYQWPLAAALGLLAGEWLIGERRKRGAKP